MKATKEKKLLVFKLLVAFLFLTVLICVGFGVHEIKAAKQSAVIVTMRSQENIVMPKNVKMPDVQSAKSEVEQKKVEPQQKQDIISENKEVYYIAVVVDDMGISPKHTKEIISIEAPLTSSFLTYGKNLKDFYEKAEASGHEIIMHTPMEPKVSADLAPDTLKISMSDDEIRTQFLDMLSKFDGVKLNGINNHMGSLFTESAAKLDIVMRILKQKEMYFFDSKTTPQSVGEHVCAVEGVDYISRDVFLDNKNEYEYISKQLKQTEKIAFKRGYAIAICHPKSETYKALKDWVTTLEGKNIKLVHLSELIKKIKEKQKSS